MHSKFCAVRKEHGDPDYTGGGGWRGLGDWRRISRVILTWLLLLVSHTPALQRNSTAPRVMFHGLELCEASDSFEARKRRGCFPEITNVWKVAGHSARKATEDHISERRE